MKRNIVLNSVIIIAALFVACKSPCQNGRGDSASAPADEPPPVVLHMVYVNDPLLPGVTEEDIDEIMQNALKTFTDKFGPLAVAISNDGVIDATEFFSRYLNKRSAEYRKYSRYAASIFGENDPEKFIKDEALFLSRNGYSLAELTLFLTNYYSESALRSATNYEAFSRLMMPIYFSKIKKLTELRQENGAPYIEPGHDYNSYNNWCAAMDRQDKYDIIICNTLIVYDTATQLYPHSALRFAKIGGSSFYSPRRPAFDGYSAMVNVFELLCSNSYFSSQYDEHSVSRSTRNQIVGSYILAHELGHMIYQIPDMYNEPDHCLMNSSSDLLNYYDGWRALMSSGEPCPLELRYAYSRKQTFSGDNFMRQSCYAEALACYSNAVGSMPASSDGDSYNHVMSLLYKKMALCYRQTGEFKDARRCFVRYREFNRKK